MKTFVSIPLVFGLCAGIAYSQAKANEKTCTEGVFTFKAPSNLSKIKGPKADNLRSQMMQGGQELAEASGTADPNLFTESTLTFFAAYELGAGDSLFVLVGDKVPVDMNRDEMFNKNSERIRWGKNAGQLSSDSRGVSKLEIDGIPSLLMDIVSPNGERLQTYTFFVPEHPKHSLAITFKTPKGQHQATIDAIVKSLTIARAGNTQATAKSTENILSTKSKRGKKEDPDFIPATPEPTKPTDDAHFESVLVSMDVAKRVAGGKNASMERVLAVYKGINLFATRQLLRGQPVQYVVNTIADIRDAMGLSELSTSDYAALGPILIMAYAYMDPATTFDTEGHIDERGKHALYTSWAAAKRLAGQNTAFVTSAQYFAGISTFAVRSALGGKPSTYIENAITETLSSVTSEHSPDDWSKMNRVFTSLYVDSKTMLDDKGHLSDAGKKAVKEGWTREDKRSIETP